MCNPGSNCSVQFPYVYSYLVPNYLSDIYYTFNSLIVIDGVFFLQKSHIITSIIVPLLSSFFFHFTKSNEVLITVVSIHRTNHLKNNKIRFPGYAFCKYPPYHTARLHSHKQTILAYISHTYNYIETLNCAKTHPPS